METNQRFEYAVSTLLRYRKLWIYPAIAGMMLAAVYLFFLKSETWTARQSLIVRDDLLGQSLKPGRFSSLESMKSAQETILEVARKPQVIRNTLTQLGPESTGLLAGSSKNWPSEELVEQIQGMITFSAPNGAEFGKTEVIILNAKASTRERSRQFIELLMNEMDKKLSEVRALRLQSMESELTQRRDAAFLSLQQSTRMLQEMEANLGADLGTMNGLISSQPTDGSVNRDLSQIRIEKRLVEAALDSALNSQEMLMAARLDPEKMLATSSEFLQSEPTLEGLKSALVDAQKAYAINSGLYQPQHPLVISSKETIGAMKEQIYLELETLTWKLDNHISVLRTRARRLDEITSSETEKLVNLGSKRVDHLTINSLVQKKTEIFHDAQSKWAEIQALRMASGQVGWITRVDSPQVSTRPDGMGKKATLLGGLVCGLMLGLGLVMLVAAPMEEPDQGRPGRRTDLPRRAADPLLAPPTLDEVVGPTAASAIQSASAATAVTVTKGVALAKSAFGRTDSTDPVSSEPPSITIPHLPQTATAASQVGDQKPVDDLIVSAAPQAEIELAESASQPVTSSEPVHSIEPVISDSAISEPETVEVATEPAAVPTAESILAQIKANNEARMQAAQEPLEGELATSERASIESEVAESENLTELETLELAPAESGTWEPESWEALIADLESGQSETLEPETPELTTEISAANQEAIVPEQRPVTAQPNVSNEGKNKSIPAPGKRSVKLQANPATVRKRPANVRPVDLAKSADDESSSFVQISPREMASTQPIDNFMASSMSSEGNADRPVEKPKDFPSPTGENPFLKHLPSRQQNAEQPDVEQAKTNAPPEKQNTMPIPDQIKSISDSIANFAKQVEPRKPNQNSGDGF